MVVNKLDVLEKVGTFKYIYDDVERTVVDKQFYKMSFENIIKKNCPTIREIIFSESAETI